MQRKEKIMTKGLKPHHHQYFEYGIKSRYDAERGVMVRNITYMCMICGRMTHEVYEDYVPPPKQKKPKALMRYKRNHGGDK